MTPPPSDRQQPRLRGVLTRLRQAMEPRDPLPAAITGAGVLLACAVTLVVNATTIATARGDFRRLTAGEAMLGIAQNCGVVVAAVVAAGVLVFARRGRLRLSIGVPAAMIGTTVMVLLNVLGKDTSAGGQFYLLFPVLYAAYHLRSPAAYLVTCYAIGIQVWFSLHMLDVVAAVHDSVVIALVLAGATLTIARVRDRQEVGEQRLRRAAEQDSLTGLASRRVFERAIRGTVPEVSTALILVDVDHFKQINDTYGHPAGDRVIQEVASQLRRVTRGEDLVARLGGDEFAVLISGCTSTAATARAADVLATITGSPAQLSNAVIPLSVSIGVAVRDTGTYEELYCAADASLYEAKRAGRGRVGQLAAPAHLAATRTGRLHQRQ